MGETTPLTEEAVAFARFQLGQWAGSVRRLIAAAPIRAVVEETGLPESGHSTPPERAAIREAALVIVDRWLARDLATLDAARAVSPDGGLRTAAQAVMDSHRKGYWNSEEFDQLEVALASPAAPAGLDVEGKVTSAYWEGTCQLLQDALLHMAMRRHEHSDGCDGCLNVQRQVAAAYDRAATRPAEDYLAAKDRSADEHSDARPAEEEQRDPIDQAKARDDMRDGVAYQEWHGHTIETEIT